MRSDDGHERLDEAQSGGDASEEGVWILFQGDLRPGESQVSENEEECRQGEEPSQDHQESGEGQSKLDLAEKIVAELLSSKLRLSVSEE